MGYNENKKGFYVVDTVYLGRRIYQTTCYRKGQEVEVEAFIREAKQQIFEARHRGIRPPVVFRDCAVAYCVAHQHHKQIVWMEKRLEEWDRFIGTVNAGELHQQHPAIRRYLLGKSGCKNKTINNYLEVVFRVLKWSADTVRDDTGLTWIATAPVFKRLPNDSAPHQPISWEEQYRLIDAVSSQGAHLKDLILVYVNTGLRDTDLLGMEWAGERLLPGNITAWVVKVKGSAKQRDKEILIVLNDIARAAIERQRGKHPVYVFTYKGRKLQRANTSAWRNARDKSGVNVTVHGLRHTFGHRLREAGVDEETRKELLGHSTSLTTHYSRASIERLHNAVQAITQQREATIIKLDAFTRKSRANTGG